MKVTLSLFGAFRSLDPGSEVILELADGARVEDLRTALEAYGRTHWPDFKPGLLQRSAFASDIEVLRDADAIPDDGRMAILPPVSGG